MEQPDKQAWNPAAGSLQELKKNNNKQPQPKKPKKTKNKKPS